MFREIGKTPACSRWYGFTLIEALIVITIIAILAAMLFPVMARAREKARTANCQSNLKQIGMGIRMYQDDYDGCTPRAVTGPAGAQLSWHWQIQPYVKNERIFTCPTRPRWYINPKARAFWAGGYSWNTQASQLYDADFSDPCGTIIVLDSWTAMNFAIGIDFNEFNIRRRADPDLYRHLQGLNLLFYDGHVKWRETRSIRQGEFTPVEGD